MNLANLLRKKVSRVITQNAKLMVGLIKLDYKEMTSVWSYTSIAVITFKVQHIKCQALLSTAYPRNSK